MRNVYKLFVGKPEGKRPLGRLRRKWQVDIRMDLTEMWWEVVDWMPLAQDSDQRWAVVNTEMNLNVP
jgi:hypothetical protein